MTYVYTLEDDPEIKVYLPDNRSIDTHRGPRAAVDVAVGDFVPCADVPWCKVTAIETVGA